MNVINKTRRIVITIRITPVTLEENAVIPRITIHKNPKILRLTLNIFSFIFFRSLYNSRNHTFKLIDRLYSLIKTALTFILNK